MRTKASLNAIEARTRDERTNENTKVFSSQMLTVANVSSLLKIWICSLYATVNKVLECFWIKATCSVLNSLSFNSCNIFQWYFPPTFNQPTNQLRFQIGVSACACAYGDENVCWCSFWWNQLDTIANAMEMVALYILPCNLVEAKVLRKMWISF